MTSRAALAHVLSLSIGASAFAGVATIALAPRTAHAQTEDELAQARALFQEAYKDEQEKRYEAALEKFRRVAAVKESASVRYRIATVLEALNRLREARDAYRACAAMKASLPANQQNIADSAAEKTLQVDKKIPKLVVTVSGESPPPDARMTVDGAPIPAGRPIEQDPGEHTIQATASGMKPFEQKVTLPDNGSQIPATVTFEPDRRVGTGPVDTLKKSNTLGYIALGAGGILMVAGVVLLVAREGAIDDINTACPNPSSCNPDNRSVVQDKEDTANLLLPLGVGFTVVGAAAAAFGVYSIVTKPKGGDAPPPAPAQGSATSRIDFAPHYVRGGAMLGLSGHF